MTQKHDLEKISITTDRLWIRNLAASDLEDFHAYRCNPSITKYQGFDVMNMDEAADFILQQRDKLFGVPGQWVQYGIENCTTKELIGDCAIKLDAYDVRIAEIGITISHLHQQLGYAKETLTALMAFLFGKKGLHRLVEIVDAENVASIQLLKSLGFRQEGHFIENIFFKGQWGSEFQFAMLQKEWVLKHPLAT